MPSSADRSVAARLLAARRALRGSPHDSASLDHFVQVLCRIDAGRHGFAFDDLRAIESGWTGDDASRWSGGLIARLHSNQRVYVTGHAGDTHWAEDASVTAEPLDPGHDALRQDGERWDEEIARRLNELLARAA
jgi:citrate lyase beta subunit